MKRDEFMARLESLLQNISKEEREEALQYYNDYFDDAGVENEASIIKELGSPEKVARTLKEDIEGLEADGGEYSESGYSYSGEQEKQVPAEKKKPWTSNTVKIILIILIILVGVPLVIPAGVSVLAVGFSILAAIAAVIFGILFSGLAIGIAGVALIIFGLMKIPVAVTVTLGCAGAGLFLTAVGIALTVLIWKLALKVIPRVFRWAVNLVRKLFHKEVQ